MDSHPSCYATMPAPCRRLPPTHPSPNLSPTRPESTRSPRASGAKPPPTLSSSRILLNLALVLSLLCAPVAAESPATVIPAPFVAETEPPPPDIPTSTEVSSSSSLPATVEPPATMEQAPHAVSSVPTVVLTGTGTGLPRDLFLPLFTQDDTRNCQECVVAEQVLNSAALPCGCVYPMLVNLTLSTAYDEFGRDAARGLLRSFATAVGASYQQVVLLHVERDPYYGVLMMIGIIPMKMRDGFIAASEVTAITARLYKTEFRNSPETADVSILAVTPPAILLNSADVGGTTVPSPSPPPNIRRHKNFISTRDFIVLAAVVLFVLIVAIAVIACALVHHRRRRRLRRELSRIPLSIRSKSTDDSSMVSGWMWGLFPPMGSKRPSISFSLSAPDTPVRLKRFTIKELKEMTNNFSEQNLLGEGGFGRVYRAIQDGMAIAAIKKLEPNKESGEKEFWREVEVMSTLQHRNLVRLLGYCTDSENRLLAYELCSNGSLQDNLYTESKKLALNWDLRLKIALGAARGLQYLHDHRPPIVHRDFKSSNVLLDDNCIAKVSDFGLARLMPQGDQQPPVNTRVLGTFGYVAPEYVMTGQLTTKSDVYSYGVVVLELITGRTPVDMNRPAGEQSLVTWASPCLSEKAKLLKILDPALQDLVDYRQLAQMAALAALCIQPDENYRPLMEDVVRALENIVRDDIPASRPVSGEIQALTLLIPSTSGSQPQHSSSSDTLSPVRRPKSTGSGYNSG